MGKPKMSSNDRLLENRTLYHGDNLDFLRRLPPDSLDLVYIDPPFQKGKDFVGKTGTLAEEAMFQDSWKWLEDVNTEWLDFYRENWPSVAGVIENSKYARDYGMAAFLSWLGLRLIECHRILKDTGSIYLHCDPTASHYLKMLMDAVFGVNNFRNEIVWCYRTGGATKTHFARKHDVILFYSKSNRWTFNQPKERSYTENLKWSKSSQVYTDEYGRYQNRLFSKTIIKVYQDDHGRFYTITGGRDYWNLDAIGRTSKERTGYPTQKPLALLELIIKASSNEGDLVADFFMGSGTTAIAAERLNRCWIGADAWSDAGATIKSRLDLEFGVLDPESKPLLQIKEINRPYVIQNDISEFNEYPITEEVFSHPVTPTKKTTNAKWKSQLVSENMLTDTNGNSLWICLGCQELFTHTRHFTVDHKIPVSKGGLDVIENVQLLCGSCNYTKNNLRTLAELREYNKMKGHFQYPDLDKKVTYKSEMTSLRMIIESWTDGLITAPQLSEDVARDPSLINKQRKKKLHRKSLSC